MSQIAWNKFNFPIKSKKEYYQLWLYQEARRLRNLAPGQKLIKGTELVLDEKATFSYLTSPVYDLSAFGTLGAQLSYPLDQGTVLVLEKRLTANPLLGHQIKSPVWTARIGNLEYVVKIFQACFHKPNWYDYLGCRDFFPEEEQAHREAFAYASLKQLQGRNIPESYGFYKVKILIHEWWGKNSWISLLQTKLPSGDSATIHVMEYIPGPTLEVLMQNEKMEKMYSLTEATNKRLVSTIC